MRLTVIGSSGSFPGPDSPASCYLLEAPYEGRPFRLVLDLGSGALGALQRYVDLGDIDAVALTHLHADHCLDLCGFYVVRKYHPAGRMPRLPVYGPRGARERIARAYDLDPAIGMREEFGFHCYGDEPSVIGPFTVTASRVDHPVDAYALRIVHGGRSLVFTGDTGPCDEITELAEGADVLLSEASFVVGGDNPPHLHLTGEDAALIATKAGVGRLVLTHIPPWHSPRQVLDDASPHFAGPIHLAKPGLVVDI